VTDTAGLRRDEQASDEVERIGIGRSWDAIRTADCVIFLHDLTRAGQDAVYDAAEREIEASLPLGVAVIHVWNKADAAGPAETGQVGVLASIEGPQGRCVAATADVIVGADVPLDALRLSARTGQGLQALRQALLQAAGWQAAPEGVFIARARHVQALQRSAQHLDTAQAHLLSPAPALDLLAEELRLAHQALGEITGVFTADDLLGEIFGKFCIGK
jgi:tRNA modification GTPase